MLCCTLHPHTSTHTQTYRDMHVWRAVGCSRLPAYRCVYVTWNSFPNQFSYTCIFQHFTTVSILQHIFLLLPFVSATSVHLLFYFCMCGMPQQHAFYAGVSCFAHLNIQCCWSVVSQRWHRYQLSISSIVCYWRLQQHLKYRYFIYFNKCSR